MLLVYAGFGVRKRPEILGRLFSTLVVADCGVPKSTPSLGVTVQVMLDGWANGPERIELLLFCRTPSINHS